MRIVNTGNLYHLYDDNSLKTYNNLPAKTYKLSFSKMSGFFLEESLNIEVNEKIYGIHNEKINKVFNSFTLFERHMGVILSGDKGIGKSLFAKLLAIKAIENNYPVIIIDTYYPGIADFLSKIEQEVFILFDEFEKTFKSNDGFDPQAEMLTLFDGFSTGKKCFIITCNKLKELNDYLVNRPGRFHYHFRFDYPCEIEIKEYLKDKLNPDYYVTEIDKIITFASKVKINYDCLRAIAFELNLGISFEDAIKDINIVNVDPIRYNITAYFTDGFKLTLSNYTFDLFNDSIEHITFYDRKAEIDYNCTFNTGNATYDPVNKCMMLTKNDIEVIPTSYEDDTEVKAKTREVDFILFKEIKARNIHYMV